MKIAFSTSGGGLQGPLDPRFGRAARFLVYDLHDASSTEVDNSVNLNAAQGAGIQSAQRLVDLQVQALITGHCGPKAYRVLEAAQIAVYPCQAATIAEALALYQAGKLTPLAGPSVDGHWV